MESCEHGHVPHTCTACHRSAELEQLRAREAELAVLLNNATQLAHEEGERRKGWRSRAEQAEADRDAARATVKRVRELPAKWRRIAVGHDNEAELYAAAEARRRADELEAVLPPKEG